MKYTDCSLWLHPPEPYYSEYQEVIKDLSGKHNTQVFEPHLTLIGRVMGDHDELKEMTEEFVSGLHTIDVSLTNISTLPDRYFQCVFMLAEKTEYLMQVNAAARSTFTVEKHDNPNYMPHLSLLYDNMEEDERRAVIELLPDLSSDFTIDTIRLMYTTGEPEEWHEIERYQLK